MTDLGEPKEELRQPIREIRFFEPDEKIVIQKASSEDFIESREVPIKQLGASANLFLRRPHDDDIEAEYIDGTGKNTPAFAIQEDGTLIKGTASEFAKDGYFQLNARVENTNVEAFKKNPVVTRVRVEGGSFTLQANSRYSLLENEAEPTTGNIIAQDFSLVDQPDNQSRSLFVPPTTHILSKIRVSYATTTQAQGGEK